ncbi:hypothetical protein JG687_00015893 [Phytophthora cactorum]|uniref:ZSWIM1/3 RNaseH-like domain-containing protein n=1 Tax=Phytophthora cactorum TaxID=29920 RepID=A0A8T1TVR6_9STRA|nr:hypothetical protein JG687_00015893 [Phytophthora cactorum]
MSDERSVRLRHAITQFKSSNPAWTNVRCVVVVLDKDFTEIGVFTSEPADTRILLCQFRAVKYV